MKLEKLMKQKQALEAQIAAAENAQRNKERLEKFIVRTLSKHDHLFTTAPEAVERELLLAIGDVSTRFKG